MGKIIFRNNGEEHNFWQNYTDLLAGFLIVFIIASLIAYGQYKIYVDSFNKQGVSLHNISDIVVNAELYNKIRAFQEAQKSIQRDYFRYNAQYNRFECTVDVRFQPNSHILSSSPSLRDSLIAAGRELQEIINDFKSSTDVSFKVVIEGRAAKSHKNPNSTESQKEYAATLSYERARQPYLLWKNERILDSIDDDNYEIFVCGSGLDGVGRYEGYGSEGEDRNKTFIIQIIPYITNN